MHQHRWLHTFYLCLIFLFFTQQGISQQVSVKATINQNQILIGQPIQLVLEASINGNDAGCNWFPINDTLPHFEYIYKNKIDTLATATGKQYKQTITLTSFDSGQWHIPALPLTIGNKNYFTDSLLVTVSFSPFDPSKDYHDIKDILPVEALQVTYINWAIAAAAIVSALLLLFFLTRKVIAPSIKIATPFSKHTPLQEALQALAALQQNNAATPESINALHLQLSHILRWFVYRKTAEATLEKTSSELLLQLTNYSLSKKRHTQLVQTLAINDAVKFAKYLPTAEENIESLTTIKTVIEKLDKKIK
jgi:hypothetical protein